MDDDKPKACDGGETREVYHPGTSFEECLACGSAVRWDLQDNRFFGWQTCPHRAKPGQHEDES